MRVPAAVRLLAVGDTGPTFSPRKIFEKVSPAFKSADLRFAQVERVFSKRGALQVSYGSAHSRVDPELVDEYSSAGIDVVSLASNHSMDWGPDALIDTIDAFRQHGISTVGAGSNIIEARKPTVVNRNGIRLAVLAYCSLLAPGYWATSTRAGAAPLRAKTFYETVDFQPATPVQIVSVPEEPDLQQMRNDIKAARAQADVVAVSCHWGVHFIPEKITDYEREYAHSAIDAGCDLIIGHGPHLLKGIEFYKDKPIIYSLGNFALGGSPPKGIPLKGELTNDDIYDFEFGPNLKYSHKQYSRHTAIAAATFLKNGTTSIELLPAYIGDDKRPALVTRGDPKFEEIVELLKWSSRKFKTNFEVRDDKLLLQT